MDTPSPLLIGLIRGGINRFTDITGADRFMVCTGHRAHYVCCGRDALYLQYRLCFPARVDYLLS